MSICASSFWTLARGITAAAGGVDLHKLRALQAVCEEDARVGSPCSGAIGSVP